MGTWELEGFHLERRVIAMKVRRSSRRSRRVKMLRFWSIMLTIALLTTTIVPSLMLDARAADEGMSEQTQEEVIEGDDSADEPIAIVIGDSADVKEDPKEDLKEDVKEDGKEDGKNIVKDGPKETLEDGENKKEDTEELQPDPTDPKEQGKHTIRYGHFTPKGRGAVNSLVGQRDRGARFARELAASQLGVDKELNYLFSTDVSLDEGVPFPEEGITVTVPAPGVGDGEMVILLHYVESAGYWEALSGIVNGGTVSVHLMSFSPIVVYVPIPTEEKEEEIEKLPETVELTFYDGVTGEKISKVEVEENVEFRDFPTPLEHENHTFIGWSHNNSRILEEDEYVVVHQDTIFVAIYKGVSYGITYNLGGGTNHGKNPTTYSQEDLPMLFYPPTRTNYVFKGWVVEGEGIPAGSVAIPSGTTGNVKVTAIWESITGGPGGSTVTINDSSGYSFVVIRTLNNANGITYVVGYNPQGQYIGYNVAPTPKGTDVESVLFKFYGASITFNYRFSGNTLVMAVGGGPSISINEFTVEFRPGQWGAFEAENSTVKKGDPTPNPPENYSIPRVSTLSSGMVFAGWLEQGDTSGRFLQTADLPETVEKSVVYTAQWAIMGNLSYLVNYLEEGTEEVLASQKQVTNMTFGQMTPEEFAKVIEGYELVNSKLNPQSIKIGAGDNVINFFYKAKTYTVTFLDHNGDILHKEENVKHGTKVAPIDDPTREDHYFSHWDDEANLKNITSDVEVVAVYKPITVIHLVIAGNQDIVTYDGKEHKVEGYTVYGVDNTGKVLYDQGDLDELGIIVTPLLDSGTATIKEVNANEKGYPMGLQQEDFKVTVNEPHKFDIKVEVKDGSLIINKLKVHILAEDIYIIYGDSLPVESDVELDSPNKGDLPEGVTLESLVEVSFDTEQEPDLPGLYKDYIILTGKEDDNITVTTGNGNLTILKLGEILILVPDSSKVYGDKDPSLKDLVVVHGDTKGELKYMVRRTLGEGVGEYDIKVVVREERNSNYDLKDLTILNSDVTGDKGTFTILPRAVTITSATNSGPYNGLPFTDPNYTITDPVLKGEIERVDVTGSVTFVEEGKVPNTISEYTLKPGFSKSNYNVTLNEGRLHVTPIEGSIDIPDTMDIAGVIVPNGGKLMFDGYQHNLQATNGVDIKDDLRINYQYKITDQEGNIIKDWTDWSKDVPSLTQVGIMNVKAKTTNPNYLEATATGTLEIIPRPVTLTVHNDSKVVGTADSVGYKGYTRSIHEEEIPGKIEGKTLEGIKGEWTGLTVSRSNLEVEAVGLYEGVLEVKPLKVDNFELQVIFGDFEITPASTPPGPIEDDPIIPRPDDPVVPGPVDPVIPGPVDPVIPGPVDPIIPGPIDPILPLPVDDLPFTPILPVTPADPGVPLAPSPILPVPDTVIYPDPVAPTPTEPTPTEIPDNIVPTAGLADDLVPLANRRGGGQWALLNLILTVLTAAATAVLWALYFVNKRKEEEEEEEEKAMASGNRDEEQVLKRHGLWRILSIVPAITAIVVFILTEDMRLQMVFTDRWTIVMALIALVQVAVIILAKKKLKKQKEEGNLEEAITSEQGEVLTSVGIEEEA